ncbi:MAG: hypothetical protein U5K69_11900 [Balneolaceae bacterium]|nr:hypothetical protein [Balneolaceae bacterium]
MYAILLFLIQQSDTTTAAQDSLDMALQQQSMSIFDLLVEGGILMIPLVPALGT